MDYTQRDPFGMYKPLPGDSAGPDGRVGPGPTLMGADTLMGNAVCNHRDEALGDIKEIMIDMRSGTIGYAVLAFGGLFGFGEKLFAVPWKALVLDTRHKRFVLNVEKARLKDAPGFDKDHWPDMADEVWAAQIESYYGTRPFSLPAH